MAKRVNVTQNLTINMLYPLRGPGPSDFPFWWPEKQLQTHFANTPTAQLDARLEWLHAHVPTDTGMPIGVARTDHCAPLPLAEKCLLCRAWINRDDEITAICRELKRRGAWR